MTTMRVKTIDDPGDNGGGGVSGNTGGGGGTLAQRQWLDVNWSFPATAPNPAAFEIVVFTGSNPDDSSTYLTAPIRVLGTDRRLVRSFFPKDALTNVNAAVRAIYA